MPAQLKIRFLVSAGPTREPIDPVRFLSNRSSGKMGYGLARAALGFGRVTLVSGPTRLEPPRRARVLLIETAGELARVMRREAPRADIIFQCAAVADYRVARPAPHKIKKTGKSARLRLVPTVDVLRELGRRKKPGQILVGFAAETRDLRKHALAKLRAKNLDYILANRVGRPGSGFDSDTNEALLFGKTGLVKKFPRMSKRRLAREILKMVLAGA